MPITWTQVNAGMARTEERKATGSTFYCGGCETDRQESFFDTIGIEHCSACYAPVGIELESCLALLRGDEGE